MAVKKGGKETLRTARYIFETETRIDKRTAAAVEQERKKREIRKKNKK